MSSKGGLASSESKGKQPISSFLQDRLLVTPRRILAWFYGSFFFSSVVDAPSSPHPSKMI
ncbi:UNVERIFIED_CONTAM: hypothetical protein Sindi_2290200, partial [Sesamum indicum]